jgi:hypothetical protein
MSAAGFAIIGVTVVLIAVWLVLVAGWAPLRARYPLALGSCGCALLLALLMAESGTPSWRGLPSTLAIVISLVLLVVAAQRSMPSDSDGGGSDSDGDGGLGRRPPDRPPGGGGSADPDWWPEFERGLARYTAQRERATAQRHRVGVDS